MKLILKILVSSLAVFFTASLIPGVFLDGFPNAILVAVILGLLNAFLKPMLVVLTIPVTLLTFGLFLLVINALMILLVDQAIDGFIVRGFWSAMLFSILLTIITSVLESLAGSKQQSSNE